MLRKAPILAFLMPAVVVALVASGGPGSVTDHMSYGPVGAKSLGAMAFGPENVLFIGDSRGATVYAIDLEDNAYGSDAGVHVGEIDAKIAAALGTTTDEIAINDLAVHPGSQNIYLTVTRGMGDGGEAVLVRVGHEGEIELVSLDNIRHSTAAIANPPSEDQTVGRRETLARSYTVTDLAYADGELYVAGLSNEEFASNLRRLSFPFDGEMTSTGLEIYHVSHGQNETHAPVMTLMPQRVAGETHILAAYTCTPLVAFPVEDLADGARVFGKTVAELGAGNRPLDMVGYETDGYERILIANSRHPLMKIDPQDLVGAPSLRSPTQETGIGFDTYEEPGVQQLDNLNDEFVVVLIQGEEGLYLHSIAKADL